MQNRKPLIKRASGWAKLSREFLKGKRCAACGRKTELVAHHMVPVQVDPTRELDVTNLLALCEGTTLNCHLWCGLGHWRSWNWAAHNDAPRFYERVKKRPYK